jgi:prevent-host-death family protein
LVFKGKNYFERMGTGFWLALSQDISMEEVGAFKAKNTLGALLDRVERGEEIIITRHGKPVARLVPSSGSTNRQEACAAAERIRARARGLDAFHWEEWKAHRDEGRP